MGRVALVASVLAAATGCRQLFGIDDTDVAPDASSDAFAITGLCAQSHLVCADFDTTATGLAQFDVLTTPAAVVEEQASVLAHSPPRVLVAAVAAGATTEYVLAAKAMPAPQLRVQARVWIGSATLSASCEPYFLNLHLTSPDPMVPNAVLLQLTPSGYRVTVYVDGMLTSYDAGGTHAGLKEVGLAVDVVGDAVYITTELEEVMLSVLGLTPVHQVVAVTVGVSVDGIHDACEVRFDDLVVDAW